MIVPIIHNCCVGVCALNNSDDSGCYRWIEEGEIVMIVETIVSIYLTSMILIGIFEYRRTRGILDYYLAGKKLGVFLVSFSFFATYFSTSAFLGGGGFRIYSWFSVVGISHILPHTFCYTRLDGGCTTYEGAY